MMADAFIYNHKTKETTSTFSEEGKLLSLVINLGIGDDDNTFTLEQAGRVEYTKLTKLDLGFIDDENEIHRYEGYEVEDIRYELKEDVIIKTVVDGTRDSLPTDLQSLILHISIRGIPDTNGVNLVRGELGLRDCTREEISGQALIQVLVPRLQRALQNPSEFMDVLDGYGLGIHSR